MVVSNWDDVDDAADDAVVSNWDDADDAVVESWDSPHGVVPTQMGTARLSTAEDSTERKKVQRSKVEVVRFIVYDEGEVEVTVCQKSIRIS